MRVLGRLVALLVVAVLAAAAWSAWQALQIQRDLRTAQSHVETLSRRLDAGDAAGVRAAAADLREAARAADDRASGRWWGGLTHLPVVGDDAHGVAVLSASLVVVADDGVVPLSRVVGGLDGVTTRGGLDLDAVRALDRPVARAATAFRTAADDVAAVDSAGFVDVLGTRYDDYAARVGEAADGLEAARTTVALLPAMAGGDGPRDYLLLFQNNAEIRATGGVPGAWARLHADDGRLRLLEQGSVADFPQADEPVVPLAPEEEALYGEALAEYFQDPGFTPDFPRAAEIFRGFWRRSFPDVPLDGVVAVDPVGLSYLLEGTGPVEVAGQRLGGDTLVDLLLRDAYRELDPARQDLYFAAVARTVFEQVTRRVDSPAGLLAGLARAGGEGRLLVAPVDDTEAARLAGTPVAGELTPDVDPTTPLVDVGLNDATGSKMSYYLRHAAEVEAVSCRRQRQQLTGTLTLRQAITPGRAAALPAYVTGGGRYGTEPGSQQVTVRLYGPVGGTLGELRLDGRRLTPQEPVVVGGRPAVTIPLVVSSTDDLVLTWPMETGPGQTGDGVVGVTPGVQPGGASSTFEGACG